MEDPLMMVEYECVWSGEIAWVSRHGLYIYNSYGTIASLFMPDPIQIAIAMPQF